ncbi:MAG: helix-turn-helix transcriptional regulator [Roseivirga sp.]|nr:helix-turn-helix transcriptional regulator [Roseivirga sp.]
MIATILWLGIFQCLFFISLLLSNKRRATGSQFLVIWLAIFSVHLAFIIPVSQGPVHFSISSLAKTMMLLHGPMLFLYTKVILSRKALKPVDFLHFLLFLVPFAYILSLRGEPYPVSDYALTILKTLSIPLYVLLTFRQVNLRLSWIKNQTANTAYLEIKWIKTVALLLLSTIVLGFLYISLDFLIPGLFIQAVDSLIYDLLIVLIGYFGIKQGIIYEVPTVENATAISYNTSPLQDDNLAGMVQKVLKYLETQKPYTEPGFDLNRLSQELGLPRHHLSEVLNKGIGKSFYELINSLRVKEAIALIESGKLSQLSVEGLGYEVGFNSKSAFFTHFKKITAMTPLQYQKQLKSSSD